MKASFLVGVILLGLAATLRPADAADVRMYVRHEVSAYAAWGGKATTPSMPSESRWA
jgi:hypothetical protein